MQKGPYLKSLIYGSIFPLKLPISPIPSLFVAVEKHRIVTFRQGRQSWCCLPAFFHSLVFVACSVSFLSLFLVHSHLSVLNWSKRFRLSFHVFLIDSSATLIISSFFLARSLPHTFFLPFVICCHLLTFSLLSLVFSFLYFPLLPLTLSSFYPNHEKILEQRKKGWRTQPLSVRWFLFFF